jgi:two-component system LytT family sensor kinase
MNLNWLRTYDSWTLERIGRHVLYWGGWTIFYVLVNYLVAEDDSIWPWLYFELLVLPIKMGCTYTIAYYVMPRFLYRKKYLPFIAGVAIVAGAFGMLLFLMYSEVIYPLILDKQSDIHYFGHFVFKGVDLVYIASIVLGIKFFQNYLHERERNQTLQQEKLQAELKYLKNQVHPHFLFNTLNNIYGMVLSNDGKAAETIVKLSDMLGYLLYDSDVDAISLDAEIENLENFIELERLRYSRKLDFRYLKEGLPDGMKIAPLILLPFVENAFKHGPAKEEGGSSIFLKIRVENNRLHFVVENTYNKSLIDQNIQSGIGLKNITKRLELLYPGRFTLDIQRGKTFRVELKIELEEKR